MLVIGLGPAAQKRVAVILAHLFGERPEVAADVAAFLDGYLRRVPFMAAFGLRAALWALVWLPIVFIGRPLPAHELSEEARERYLARWSDSHIYFVREAFYLVKAIALLGWGAHPVVRERLGMPPLAAPRMAA